MNPEVKAKWLAELRSGEKKQGKGTLCRDNLEGDRTYCCLGVLSQIAADEGVIPQPVRFSLRYRYGPDQNWADLPVEVMRWADLESNDPLAGDEALSSMNDRSATFRVIAEAIEEYL